MAEPVRLIVARFQEDVSWADHMPGHVTPVIVTKGDQLPNEGREAASFIWAFKNLEFGANETIACVQGDPFVHCSDLVRELYFPPTSFRPLGGWRVTCDGDGAPHHSGLPVAERYEQWFGDPFPGSLEFTSGGQFFVSGAELKGKPWDVWYERACAEDGPWLMERMWAEVFREGR